MGEWWRTFFEGAWADVHTTVIAPQRTLEDADAAERLLALEGGARVLDVPCGDGRVTLPLAERGYRVTGVDLNERFLERARSAASERGLDVRLEHRDMRDLPWEGEFDAALCLWGSFGYFDDEGDVAFLRAVHRALRPGGRFLLTTHVAETLFPQFEPRSWSRVGDTLLVEERRFDHETGRVEGEWTFVRGGRESTSRSSIRVYTYRELRRLFEGAGFGAFEAYESPDDPFSGLGARRLLAAATRGET